MAPDIACIAAPSADPSRLGIAEFRSYSLIIDARTPREYREDHIPGAVNLPLVDDAQFAEVGIAYLEDQHAAYLIGARHASSNLARHIRDTISRFTRDDRLLVYCFRGGKRSRAWADTLRAIGFRTDVIEGGWKEYRRWVREGLQSLPAAFEYRVLAGMTGCAKTRLLDALEREGNQVLNLERLASHRGSLLGDIPGTPQPTQKMFDSLLLDKLRSFGANRPVWIEGESKRVGRLQLPDALFDAMRRARPVQVTAPLAERVRLLREEYPNFVSEPEAMVEQLAPLKALVGGDEFAAWLSLARAGRVDELVERLLTTHYDAAYRRSHRSVSMHEPQASVHLPSTEAAQLSAAAQDLSRRYGRRDHG